ncbi:MAG: isopeptide-forming domain-containing fimbrial protein [Emergencia sp.]
MVDMKKSGSALILALLLLFLAAFGINAFAAVSFTKVTNTTVFEGKYSFSPRYISGKTSMETFGGYNYDEDLWNTDNFSTTNVVPIRLTGQNKGKIGAVYKNVGEYQGKIINLKITVSDWRQLRPVQNISGRKSYPTVFFFKNSIGFWVTDNMIKSPTFKLDFIDAKTSAPVSITGHQSFKDIDIGQFIESKDLSEGFLSSDTQLKVSGNKVYSASDTGDVAANDKRYWITGFFENKSAYSFIFSTQKYEDADFENAMTTRSVDQLSLTGETFAPFDTPTPIKSVDRTAVYRDEVINYSIKFTTPQESQDYYYTKFVLEDVLPAPLQYVDGSFSAVDDGGSGSTDRFAASFSDQKLTIRGKDSAISAASFYNKTYTMNFKAKVREGYDFYAFAGGRGDIVNLENRASLSTKSAVRKETTKQSNLVETEVEFRIETSTDGHGTITSSIADISGGSEMTIIYAPKPGYQISKVLVDGRAVDLNRYQEQYTFSRIYDNHVIRAEFIPVMDNRITVTKRIEREDVYLPYGIPSVIFRLSGTDVSGNFHEYHQAVILDEKALTGGIYTASVTFDQLVSGTYILEEVESSRYRVVSISDLFGGKRIGDRTEFDLIHNRVGRCTYTNSLENYSLFSHRDIIVNTF